MSRRWFLRSPLQRPMAKGGAPALILKGYDEQMKELSDAIHALAQYCSELALSLKISDHLQEQTVERLIRLEEAVFGVDYGDLEDLEPQSDLDGFILEEVDEDGITEGEFSDIDDDVDALEPDVVREPEEPSSP